MEETREHWICEGCGTDYAEYVNGCPRCWDDTLERDDNLKKYPKRAVVYSHTTPHFN